MTTHRPKDFRERCARANTRGIALVVVLSALVLLSGLMIAFFLSVSTERSGAKSFADNNDARKLADTALNIVVAQLKDATTSGTTAAWASQPGLIRTFDSGGTQTAAFKLYSASSLRDGSTFNPGDNDVVPTDWFGKPALYTDLNAPVYVPSSSGTVSIGTQTFAANYPIIDAGVLDVPEASAVKGFSVSSAPLNSGSANFNRVPMPVQWLYVLQNGEIVPASSAASGSSSTALLSGSPASEKNPIVGRIAFWTDDETCKVNINTAAGDVWNDTSAPGGYSDMPYSKCATDNKLLKNQPVQHEYQRYPGHPATTYLSAVFPGTITSRQKLYDIVPRVTYYRLGDTAKNDISSQGGTVQTSLTSWSSGPLPLSDGDHLYASVDELQFVTTQANLKGTTRPTNLFTPDEVKQAKFFLTAQSRAPELNLFGKPRISMWPQIVNSSGTLTGSAFDKTIAFCSTLGAASANHPNVYYFVRNDPTSPTADYANYARNQSLYAYLQNLTGRDVPGFGGSFSAKYGDDRDQILTEMFDYIRSSINLFDTSNTANPNPYTGTYSSSTKSTNQRAQPAGTGHVVPIQIGSTRGLGRTYIPDSPILHLVGLEAMVDPAALAAVKSTSQYPKVTPGVLYGKHQGADKASIFVNKVQAVLLFNNFCPALGVVRIVPDLIYEVKGLESLALNGTNLGFPASCSTDFNSNSPNHEYGWGSFSSPACLFWRNMYTPKVLGTGPNDYPFYSSVINFPTNTVKFKQPLLLTGAKITLNIYARDKSHQKIATPIQTIVYHFPDTWVPCPGVSGCVKRTYNSDASTGYDDSPTLSCVPNPYSTPPGTERTYATGREVSLGAGIDAPGPIAPGYNYGSVGGQIVYDVTRGLVPYHGDMRLALTSGTIEADATGTNVFVPALGYQKTAADIDQSITASYFSNNANMEGSSGGMVSGVSPRASNGGGWFATSGILVPEATYERHVNTKDGNFGPAVSSLITAARLKAKDGTQQPGDWDNGMGGIPDGPYINKADEGDIGAGAYGSSDDYPTSATLFSPNRQVPSPVIFGSLPSGAKAARPWQTLLFCPNPPAKSLHPGTASPPDHLLLDLFSMPVVEPYAISEPFSTAGKINMNYQIAPFTYIKRNTGMQAVLRSTRIPAIPTGDGLVYKNGTPASDYRLNVNIDDTLKAFDARFTANKPFRSASEICDMFLVPQGVSIASGDDVASTMAAWWDGYRLTGDNLREKPYAHTYSRLTTKSNSYTVHVRVQALKKRSNDPNQNQWVEGRDRVVGEYRGSFTIERFIDLNDATLSSFDETYFGNTLYDASGNVTKTGQLDPFYRIRVVDTKQFAP